MRPLQEDDKPNTLVSEETDKASYEDFFDNVKTFQFDKTISIQSRDLHSGEGSCISIQVLKPLIIKLITWVTDIDIL